MVHAQKVLYVDASSGSDSTSYAGNGPSTPWQTIGRATWGSVDRDAPNPGQAAQPGDTVRIAGGMYAFTLRTGHGRYDVLYNPVNDGTRDKPIVFDATDVVELVARSWGGPVIGSTSAHYITWRGPFLIDEANIRTAPDTGPVVFHLSTGSGIDGATIHGAGATWPDNHVAVRFDACTGCFVRNTTMDNFKSLQGATSRNGAGVMLYDSNETLIEHNEIFDCGSGVYIKGVQLRDSQDGTVVRFNLIRDVLSFGVILQPSTNGRIYQNVLRNNRIGVLISGTSEPGNHPENDVVANNTIHGSIEAAVVFNGDGWKNVRFWNNIITDTPYVHYSDSRVDLGGIDMQRNVYSGFPGSRFAAFGGVKYSLENWMSSFKQDSASTSSNPGYVDPDGNDLRLSPSSPVVTVGVDVLDLDGDGRTSDIIRPGAYVSGNEVIGPRPLEPHSSRGSSRP